MTANKRQQVWETRMKVFTVCGFEGTKDNSFTKDNKSTNEIEDQPVMTAGLFEVNPNRREK